METTSTEDRSAGRGTKGLDPGRMPVRPHRSRHRPKAAGAACPGCPRFLAPLLRTRPNG